MRFLALLVFAGGLGAAVLLSPLSESTGSSTEPGTSDSPVSVATLPSVETPGEGRSFLGHHYDRSVVRDPTGREPQSKLWFARGSWWALMFEPTTHELRIHRLDWETQTWVDTGVLVDERPFVHADANWDGERLYVVSSGWKDRPTHAVRVLRFRELAGAPWYELDEGFPVSITDRGVTEPVIAKDSTGVLWVAYVLEDTLQIDRSDREQKTWSGSFVAPVEGTSVATDQTAIVSFDSAIGLMWSNQNEDTFYFAVHRDGDDDTAWKATAAVVRGLGNADDHVSLRAVELDGEPRVYAVVKTSLDAADLRNPGDPQILLLVREPDGSWSQSVVARVRDGHTRPVLAVDIEHRVLYVVLTSRRNDGIFYKAAPIERPTFPTGDGTPLIMSSEVPRVNNATVAGHAVDGESGLVVLAADGSVRRYVHAALSLGGPPVPDLAEEETIR